LDACVECGMVDGIDLDGTFKMNNRAQCILKVKILKSMSKI